MTICRNRKQPFWPRLRLTELEEWDEFVNASTPPHTHPTAFVSVNVVSGFVYNKMNDNPMTVFGVSVGQLSAQFGSNKHTQAVKCALDSTSLETPFQVT